MIKVQNSALKEKQRRRETSKSVADKQLTGAKLTLSEQTRENTQKRSNEQHNAISKSATVNSLNNTPLSPVEQSFMNKRKQSNETSKSATVNTQNNTPLSRAE